MPTSETKPVATKPDLCRGHDGCSPRAFASQSEDVFAEREPVTREGDAFVAHGCGSHPPHGAVVSKGHATVFANGKPVAFVGARVSCASGVVATGRETVRVG
jgi:uncharacterized Zn-binding protein involved in type VI secretion